MKTIRPYFFVSCIRNIFIFYPLTLSLILCVYFLGLKTFSVIKKLEKLKERNADKVLGVASNHENRELKFLEKLNSP